MKNLSRHEMKNLRGGVELAKTCTMDCDTSGHSYSTWLETACKLDSDCTSKTECSSGYTRSFHCS